MNRELVYVFCLIATVLLVSRLFWFLSALFILSGIIAYTTESPAWYLSLLALGAELLSVLALGAVTVVILVPWLIKYLGKRIDVDVSFSYFVLVLLAVAGQVLILFVWDNGLGLFKNFDIVPWFEVAITITLSTLFIFGSSVFIYFNKTW